ncbi:MAG: DUF202 domain-containing protein [Actinomycetia bacterium]|nr:DUF202 domain-containing protein [Actinomycetes bacterium]
MTGQDSHVLIDAAGPAERTALSWQRTALGVVVIGALAVRWCLNEGYPVWPGIVLATFGGVVGLLLGRQRYLRIMKTVRAGETPLSRYLVPATALFMVLIVAAISAGVGIELASL